ncbi:MAG: hypothetical protein JRC68_08960 [Deltaproteobacteria bacterium]|nr:hypothetical protein [Deltaproteobacteria bacterium]
MSKDMLNILSPVCPEVFTIGLKRQCLNKTEISHISECDTNYANPCLLALMCQIFLEPFLYPNGVRTKPRLFPQDGIFDVRGFLI